MQVTTSPRIVSQASSDSIRRSVMSDKIQMRWKLIAEREAEQKLAHAELKAVHEALRQEHVNLQTAHEELLLEFKEVTDSLQSQRRRLADSLTEATERAERAEARCVVLQDEASRHQMAWEHSQEALRESQEALRAVCAQRQAAFGDRLGEVSRLSRGLNAREVNRQGGGSTSPSLPPIAPTSPEGRHNPPARGGGGGEAATAPAAADPGSESGTTSRAPRLRRPVAPQRASSTSVSSAASTVEGREHGAPASHSSVMSESGDASILEDLDVARRGSLLSPAEVVSDEEDGLATDEHDDAHYADGATAANSNLASRNHNGGARPSPRVSRELPPLD